MGCKTPGSCGPSAACAMRPFDTFDGIPPHSEGIPGPILKLRQVRADAVVPAYGSAGAAAFDFTCVDGPWNTWADIGTAQGVQACDMIGGHAYLFATGWEVEVPPGWVLKIYSRSGHGFRDSVRLSNCVGIIDSDYRGEVMVQLHPDRKGTTTQVRRGDRIAQGILERVERVNMMVVTQLSQTARGAAGFGSTGR